jgi:hypothetical protein
MLREINTRLITYLIDSLIIRGRENKSRDLKINKLRDIILKLKLGNTTITKLNPSSQLLNIN